ncbi:hypothetical protein ABW19_dt0201754 [Dactylella cylindrospora]|nr:hypothetical protein ABW19_dt0201754 [Dactylella cylindrospora]
MQHATHLIISILLIISLSPLIPALSSQRRQSINNTFVDFSTVPSCTNSTCYAPLPDGDDLSWNYYNLGCNHTVDFPIGDHGVTHDCFCNTALRPLLCQNYDPSQPSDCYLSLLDWYTDLCGPSTQKTININVLPSCARPCVSMTMSHLGCPDNTLSCVCQLKYFSASAAKCIENNCNGDIQLYIGSPLYTFTNKWITQACAFPNRMISKVFSTLGEFYDIANYEDYGECPRAVPQEVLVAEFHGKEYNDWQEGLNKKREKQNSLGAIIPLSLIFGGMFAGFFVQWLWVCLGFNRGNSRVGRKIERGWVKMWEGIGKGIVWCWGLTKPVRVGLVVVVKKLLSW